jgi:general stress protein 26
MSSVSPPSPKAISPDQAAALARAVVQAVSFPFLATAGLDGQPRVRPVSALHIDGFTVYLANLRSYGKTSEIADNPKVELCFLDSRHDQVRITGCAEVVDDRDTLHAIWNGNPLLHSYVNAPDDAELVVYRIIPQRVRFMREWALEYQDVMIREPA